MVRDRPGKTLGETSQGTDGGADRNLGNGDATGDPTRGADRRSVGTASDRRGSTAGAGWVTE